MSAKATESNSDQVKQPNKPIQRSIEEAFSKRIPYRKESQEYRRITESITKFIGAGMAPISVVDKPSFRNMIKTLDPRYTIPSRNIFRNTHIPQLYNEVKENLLTELKKVRHFGATMDAWTSLVGDPYLSLSLQTMYLPSDHTGENIALAVSNSLEEYGLPLPSSMSTDSGSNMIVACTKLKVQRISCIGHVLHNAVNKALQEEDIKTVLSVCRKIVSTFSFSYKMKGKFSKLQKELDLPKHKLKADVSTRWGSKFFMLQRIQEQMPAIVQLFSQGTLHM